LFLFDCLPTFEKLRINVLKVGLKPCLSAVMCPVLLPIHLLVQLVEILEFLVIDGSQRGYKTFFVVFYAFIYLFGEMKVVVLGKSCDF